MHSCVLVHHKMTTTGLACVLCVSCGLVCMEVVLLKINMLLSHSKWKMYQYYIISDESYINNEKYMKQLLKGLSVFHIMYIFTYIWNA